jgi:hypothetical protein
LLFKHLIKLKASFARWTQSRELAAQTIITSLFCRTDVRDRTEQKNTVPPRPRLTQALESWISTNKDHFASVCFDRAERNNGPYRTAERLINWALEKSNSVIFTEDDVTFEEDAVKWFERALAHPIFLRADVWAIAGESRFFDSYRHLPSKVDVCRALEVAQTQDLINRFVYLDFLPSSCFATTRDKWAEFGWNKRNYGGGTLSG